MNKKMSISKKIIGSLALPVGMYLIMMIACYSNGKMYYGTIAMWKSIITDIAVAVTCALGIGLQFRSRRFDFSGGGIMLVAGIIAANIAMKHNDNQVLFIVLCIVICTILSIFVALVYVYGRLPIVIATIGMALLYESITCLIYNGAGINLVGNMKLKIFSTYPVVLIPLAGAIVVYAIYCNFTVTGKQSTLLANNQQAAVNIGIKEKKNVIVSYLFSGIIFGFATSIYASTALHPAAFSSLTTVGALFSNILPVFIGLILAVYCGDTIGIILGAITLCLMSYGLTAVFDAELGSSISTICTSIFILFVNVVPVQGPKWLSFIKNIFSKNKVIV
jgi:ribose transport system permease protein